jgi:hypothetical protein
MKYICEYVTAKNKKIIRKVVFVLYLCNIIGIERESYCVGKASTTGQLCMSSAIRTIQNILSHSLNIFEIIFGINFKFFIIIKDGCMLIFAECSSLVNLY